MMNQKPLKHFLCLAKAVCPRRVCLKWKWTKINNSSFPKYCSGILILVHATITYVFYKFISMCTKNRWVTQLISVRGMLYRHLLLPVGVSWLYTRNSYVNSGIWPCTCSFLSYIYKGKCVFAILIDQVQDKHFWQRLVLKTQHVTNVKIMSPPMIKVVVQTCLIVLKDRFCLSDILIWKHHYLTIKYKDRVFHYSTSCVFFNCADDVSVWNQVNIVMVIQPDHRWCNILVWSAVRAARYLHGSQWYCETWQQKVFAHREWEE